MGTQFLDRLGNWTNYGGATGPGNFNPQGSGGPTPQSPRYRTWIEGYASQSRTGAQGTFVGDKRKIYGGIAGLGMTVAPGATIGFSVDQGRTKVDVTGGLQSATINLTQLGLTGSFELGSWILGAALIHGFGNVDSTRNYTGGPSIASYGAHLWGAVAELSYYKAIGNSRIVPKIGADWMRSEVDAFTEVGGIVPISALSQTSQRTRVYAGAEVGHSWIAGTTIFDLAAYGKVVNVVSQQIGTLQVSATGTPVLAIQGVEDARLGFETGTGLSVFITQTLRLYALYDGKFRDGFHSNSGTVGMEVKW
jgi:uncharacterized protein with beta-barrel porin domain